MRVMELESELINVKRDRDNQRAEVKRLQAELAERPEKDASRDRNKAALQRVTFNLERARAELSGRSSGAYGAGRFPHAWVHQHRRVAFSVGFAASRAA